MSEENSTKEKKGIVKWVKGMGLAAFIFFLVKGLVWLAIFWFGAETIFQSCN